MIKMFCSLEEIKKNPISFKLQIQANSKNTKMLKTTGSHIMGRLDSQQINPQADKGQLEKKNKIEKNPVIKY